MFLSILTLKMSITITAEDAFYDIFLISFLFFFWGGGGGGWGVGGHLSELFFG